MRTPAAVLAAVLAVAGCKALEPAKDLSYGQVQAIQPGITASQVLDAYGSPGRMDRGPDGKVRAMEYPTVDPKGSRARLILDFDPNEVLLRKSYTGDIARPR